MRLSRNMGRLQLRLGAVILVALLAASCATHKAADPAAAGKAPQTEKKQPAAPVPANPFQSRIPAFGPTPVPVRAALTSTDGMAPVLKSVPTDQPVAFITIDDGTIRPKDAATLLQAKNTPASAFLISNVAAQDPAYFKGLQNIGVPIQAHSITHTSLRGKSYEAQKQEICGSADSLAGLFGTRPTLFRPPYGEYDNTTLKAANDCGMKAVLYWRESITDGRVYYQTPEKRVQRGDIILMHFRDNFVNDYLAALQAIYDAGLTPALLEDYIG